MWKSLNRSQIFKCLNDKSIRACARLWAQKILNIFFITFHSAHKIRSTSEHWFSVTVKVSKIGYRRIAHNLALPLPRLHFNPLHTWNFLHSSFGLVFNWFESESARVEEEKEEGDSSTRQELSFHARLNYFALHRIVFFILRFYGKFRTEWIFCWLPIIIYEVVCEWQRSPMSRSGNIHLFVNVNRAKCCQFLISWLVGCCGGVELYSTVLNSKYMWSVRYDELLNDDTWFNPENKHSTFTWKCSAIHPDCLSQFRLSVNERFNQEWRGRRICPKNTREISPGIQERQPSFDRCRKGKKQFMEYLNLLTVDYLSAWVCSSWKERYFPSRRKGLKKLLSMS